MIGPNRDSWWARRLPNTVEAAAADRHTVVAAIETLRPSVRPVVLHGDLNRGNILAAMREPWLAADPDPSYGGPAYDLALVVADQVDPHVDTPRRRSASSPC